MANREVVPAGALTTMGNGAAPGGEMNRDQTVSVKVFSGGYPKGTPAPAAKVEADSDDGLAELKAKFAAAQSGESASEKLARLEQCLPPGNARFAAGIKLPVHQGTGFEPPK